MQNGKGQVKPSKLSSLCAFSTSGLAWRNHSWYGGVLVGVEKAKLENRAFYNFPFFCLSLGTSTNPHRDETEAHQVNNSCKKCASLQEYSVLRLKPRMNKNFQLTTPSVILIWNVKLREKWMQRLSCYIFNFTRLNLFGIFDRWKTEVRHVLKDLTDHLLSR